MKSIRVTRDAKTIKATRRPGRFRLKFNPVKLKPGKHTIRVRVTDSKGRSKSFKKTFRVCAKPKAMDTKG